MKTVDYAVLKQQTRGTRRLLRATRNALAGLLAAWRGEAAFRLEVLGAAVAMPLAFLLVDDAISRALLVGSVALVLIVELLNTAIEAIVDLVCPEHHPLAGKAKDVASAAVLLALTGAAAVWSIVMWGLWRA